jgi:amidase
MQELLFAPAHQLINWIRHREISCLDLLEAHLAQIERVNPHLNAIITLDAEGARRRAREADAALARGEWWGPLHGLPLTLKDSHMTAGLRTTCGHPPLKDWIPDEDGAVAARLRAAGAILIGKTNVPALCDDWQSVNPLFGRTKNPWHPDRTPGGSSGGAAAAVAAGMSPLEIGSDIGGSIRVPAHFCGLYGFKPTEHRVSGLGHIPPLPGAGATVRLMNCIGPIARSVSDLALAYSVIAGPFPGDPDVPPVPVQPIKRIEIKGLRIAWAPSFPGSPAAAPIRTAIAHLAARLADEGAHVAAALPDLSGQRTFVASAADQCDLWAEYEAAFTRLIGLIWQGKPAAAADLLAAIADRDRFITAWERFFTEWDAILCPVTATTAFAHADQVTELLVDGQPVPYKWAFNFCRLINLTGHPAVVLPLGQDAEGLPFGVQLIGPRWGDERLLGIALGMEELTPGYRRPPGC